jgi:hypothetical protein
MKSKINFYFLALSGFLLTNVHAFGASGVIAGDTYISQAAPANNYGSLPSLSVANGNTAFIQFNLSTLPAGIVAADISKATLILFANRVSEAGTIDLATVSGSWSESQLTAQNAPGYTAIPGATAALSQSDQYIMFDVTATVANWVTTPSLNNGFALVADPSTPTISVLLDSKESTSTSHPAVLEVTLINTGLPGPQGPMGLQGPQGLTGATGPQGPVGPTDPKWTALSAVLGTNGYTQGASYNVGTNCVIGTLILSAVTPTGSVIPTDGRLLPISQYTPLFSLIGTKFGGDGFATFQLPDLRNATPQGMAYGICVSGIYP